MAQMMNVLPMPEPIDTIALGRMNPAIYHDVYTRNINAQILQEKIRMGHPPLDLSAFSSKVTHYKERQMSVDMIGMSGNTQQNIMAAAAAAVMTTVAFF